MTKYIATFADGTTISRKTARAYGAAWRATWTNADGTVRSETGFSISREKAQPYKPAPWATGRGFSAKQNAEAARKNEEYVQSIGYCVEIVPAVAA